MRGWEGRGHREGIAAWKEKGLCRSGCLERNSVSAGGNSTRKRKPENEYPALISLMSSCVLLWLLVDQRVQEAAGVIHRGRIRVGEGQPSKKENEGD